MQKLKITALIFSILLLLPTFSNRESIQTLNVISITKDVTCLAKNLYHEAALEPEEGKMAVSQIVLNRLNDPRYPKDVCSVVYQKTGKIYQFSWVGMGKLKETNQKIWVECLTIAHKAIFHGRIHEELAKSNALFYHAVYINPKWRLKKVTRIGSHIFYRE